MNLKSGVSLATVGKISTRLKLSKGDRELLRDLYLAKGKQVYVEGKIQTDEYEKDGVKRRATKIIASEVKFLGGGTRHENVEQGAKEAGISDSDMSKATTVFDDSDIPF